MVNKATNIQVMAIVVERRPEWSDHGSVQCRRLAHVYVLDENAVIRHKQVIEERLDEAVDALLKTIEKTKPYARS